MPEPLFQKAQAILDFPVKEAEIHEFWAQNKIFEKSLILREGAPKFVFNEGPPTANGLPHNGHVLTRVFKDVFLRYRTMRGYQVPRKAGWDTHGLPVEVEVEKELGIHGKEAIEEYGVKPFILKCMESVFRYTEQWERMTNRIGFWVDLEDAYVTYHKSYVESVWWALSELFRKGLLYKGHKIVWWWAQGGTALSAGEVGQGYKEVDDPSVYVRFPLVDQPGVSLLIWTTTPWTLPSNQFAAVRPEYDYVQVKYGEESLVLAAALKETIEQKVEGEFTVEREMKGAELLGERYRPPFDFFFNKYGHETAALKDGGEEPKLWQVLAADFVELDSGTGIVHEAPAFGEVDFDLLKNYRARFVDPDAIPLFCPIKPDGTFTDEVPAYKGQWVKGADKHIIRDLRERGALMHQENYRHDYPFCWRADDDPLIQYARPAWFIKTTARIGNAIKNSESATWHPANVGTGRFGDFLANNVDWALSRERYWGTPLNIWINDATGQVAAPASVDEILAKNPNAFDHFHADRAANSSLSEHLMVHKPWIDEVTWTEPGEPGVYRRVPEVIDCWFDSGCVPFAQFGYPHVGREEFAGRFPADYITEAIDQTRGWFYSQLMISTLLFEQETEERCGLPHVDYPHPFKNCLVLGHVTDAEGKKESKSKGNYTPPELIYNEVRQDFAVVTSDEVELELDDDDIALCREDVAGLDILPGADLFAASVEVSPGIRLHARQNKKVPRKAAVLTPATAKRLQLQANGNGAAVKPTDVAWLPHSERVSVAVAGANAPGADAFRWFFFAGNPPWSPTRHSLGNVRGLQKELPLKLRNVYSFFTIYAEIDGYNPTKHDGRPVSERALLDRWILSELNLAKQKVVEHMDGFRAYEAAGVLSEFVDGLSNWYVRRSRPRYWKSEFDVDKQDAYATLYECLTSCIRLTAPFIPFQSEEIYQNIVRGPQADAPESVHLTDLPAADEAAIDEALSREMAAVRNIVSLGLRVRTDNKIRVRQPLGSAEVILTDADLAKRLAVYRGLIEEELNVHEVEFTSGGSEHVRYLVKPNFRALGPRLGKKMKLAKKAFAEADAAQLRAQLLSEGRAQIVIGGDAVALEPSDVDVAVEAAEHFAAAGDSSTVVVLNTELTPELLDEGLLRELLRRVQDLRKDLDVEYTERITLDITGSDRVQRVLEANRGHFTGEVLCTDLSFGGAESGEATKELEIDGEAVSITLGRKV